MNVEVAGCEGAGEPGAASSGAVRFRYGAAGRQAGPAAASGHHPHRREGRGAVQDARGTARQDVKVNELRGQSNLQRLKISIID